MENAYQVVDIIRSYKNLSLIKCILRCIENPRCVSVFHNTEDKQCLLHLGILNDILIRNDSRWRFYTINEGRLSKGIVYKEDQGNLI